MPRKSGRRWKKLPANQALGAMLKMRAREGAHLAKDLAARTTGMRRAVEKIRQQAPLTAENHRQQLLGRVKAAGLENIAPDDERLLKEVVLFRGSLGYHERN